MFSRAALKFALLCSVLTPFAQAEIFERIGISQTPDTTTVTLRTHIPTGYAQPKLTNCISTGTSLNCILKTQKPEAGLPQLASPVPRVISVTLPYRADIWHVNINYKGKNYKVKS